MHDASNPGALCTDEAFSDEQKHYRAGFFTAVKQRVPSVGHTLTGQITANQESGLLNEAAAAADLFHGTPVDELCREEMWKYEQNPLGIWDKLLACAQEDSPPSAEDMFRFKFHGLFYVAPAQDSFRLRVRVPGARLSSARLRGLATIARDWGCGRADITTRANLQSRDIDSVLDTLQALGMGSRGAGADNVRNITASPLSGMDPEESLDVLPYAEALNQYILNSRVLYGLPRKFNVAFDSGGAINVVADTNDIGLLAVL